MKIHLPLYGQVRPHVSYSETRLFNECEWKWFLTKVCNKSAGFRSFHADFGKAIHSAMEVLFGPDLEKRSTAADVARKIYTEFLSNIGELHPTDKKESDRLLEMIDPIVTGIGECPDLVGAEPIICELDLFEPINRNDGLNVNFKGFIDIIFKKKLKRKTVLYLADFKTCSWGWPAKKYQDMAVISQIILYKHFFVKKLGCDPKDVTICFIMLKKKPGPNAPIVEVRKIGSGPKATMEALKFLQDSITGMHRFSYSTNRNSCVRNWVDQETKEERESRCEFFGTHDCPSTQISIT